MYAAEFELFLRSWDTHVLVPLGDLCATGYMLSFAAIVRNSNAGLRCEVPDVVPFTSVPFLASARALKPCP